MADSEQPSHNIAVETHDGLTVRGDVFGPANGRPAIFLHGGGQSRSSWRGAARRLASAGFRACAMDLRGHGESDWSGAGNYGFDDYVADLRATMAEVGEPALLIGASMGGHIALIAAARYPKQVSGLALADVTPWVDENKGDEIRNAMRQARHGFTSVEEAARMVDAMRGTPSQDDISGLRRHMRTGPDGRFYWRWDPAMLADEHLRHGGESGLLVEEARRLSLPVLLMLAEHSTITDAEQAKAFKAVIPWLRTVTIEGAGHMVTGDLNDTYAGHILAFANSLNTTPSGETP